MHFSKDKIRRERGERRKEKRTQGEDREREKERRRERTQGKRGRETRKKGIERGERNAITITPLPRTVNRLGLKSGRPRIKSPFCFIKNRLLNSNLQNSV